MIKTTALDGVFYWSRYQADRGIDFNGFLIVTPAGNVLVDPLQLEGHELEDVRSKGGARWILVTNFDHLREAVELKAEFGAELLAPTEDRERFAEAAGAVDVWLERDADLPSDLSGVLELHALRGGKSPVELALRLPTRRALLFGDLVRSHVSGKLCLLPPPKLSDPGAVRDSLVPLQQLDFDALLLGDGDCLFRGGRAAFAELVLSLS